MDPTMQHKFDELTGDIESTARALSQTPDGHPDIPMLLSRLVNAHNARFHLRHEPEDINKVIEYASAILFLISDDNPGFLGVFIVLGVAYSERFQRLGDVADLGQGIHLMSTAITMIPNHHQHLPGLFSDLAIAHKFRFIHLGELIDIEKAIEYDTKAIEATPEHHPILSELFDKLGSSHGVRFQHLGELNDLEKTIECQTRGLAIAPGGCSYLPTLLTNLGSSHNQRFKRLGDLDDVEKSIKYLSRAGELIPSDDPHLPSHLDNLGASYRARYQGLGDLGDLQKTIECRSRAVALTPDNHPSLPGRLAKLATSHSDRFHRLGNLDDLNTAIEYESQAVSLTPGKHPDLPGFLENLGMSHRSRFRSLGSLDDIQKAIDYGSRALVLIPDGHPSLSISLINLGASYSRRFQSLGDLDDLKQAIEFEARALAAIPNDHPSSCRLHYNHALTYIRLYDHSEDPASLQQSLNHLRIASKSPSWASRDRFINARNWADFASRNSALNPIEAHQTAIDLLPHFVWLGASVDQRYEDLKMVATLAVDAAYAAILSANYALALEWLEHARCVVWHQNLALRLPLSQLEASHPSLASSLKTVSEELHSTSLGSREPQVLPSASMVSEEVGQRRRQLAKEYEELLTQARTLPGFEGLFQPMKIDGLTRAARNGPVVVINCHENHCDALLVLPTHSTVTHLPLPNFGRKEALDNRSKIGSSLMRLGLRERGVHIKREPGAKDGFASALVAIWKGIVKPVLDFLGYTSTNDANGNLPYITWCPTGPVSFLPLHAAGDYDQPGPGSRVFDYAISSYTPTLTALINTTPSVLNGDLRVLAVGQAATPGHKQLPGTTIELEYVKSQVHSKGKYSQLIDAQATPETVLDAMEQHDWVHLACHAHQNVHDPTKSGFFLHGDVNGTKETLDMTSINRRSLKKKGLAFLSACQTATGDEALPDEAVHLASGMMMAGYSSVIATMWSVVDQDAPFVADKVYGRLMMEGKLGNGEAGKALHDAVVGLREKVGEEEFGRWVPYIHVGS